MADSILTDAERRFVHELEARGVRYLIVGMSAALIQGARGATEDIDIAGRVLGRARLGGCSAPG